MPAGLRIHNHNNALEILQSRCNGLALKELNEFLNRMPLIRFEGKSEKNPVLEYLQTCMNPLIDYVLKNHYGWHTQVDLPGGPKGNNFDFYKKWSTNLRIWMEVEFANSARIDSDIRKLRTAAHCGLSDVGILVVCTDQLAPYVDGNIATFDAARETILSEACNDFPCLIIGLELNPAKVLDVTGWGYALEHLKRESNQDVKAHLAERIWTQHILPSLPNASMHAHHLDMVRILGFNPGMQKPAFPQMSEKLTAAPDVLTLNEDGTISVFVETTKPGRRSRSAQGHSQSKRDAKPIGATQLSLHLDVGATAVGELPSCAPGQSALSSPNLDSGFELNRHPSQLTADAPPEAAAAPTTALAAPVRTSEETEAAAQVAPPPLPASTIAPIRGVQLQLLSSTDTATTRYPAPRPVAKPVEGPRLGPWLSRGAVASPFVHSLA